MASFLDGNACVVGLQWGDEGKGKIVDYLAEQADMVVRYCGGANAGHTVRIGDQKYSTHLLPVGVFRPGVMNIIGNGVVLDPEALFAEMDEFAARGISITPDNLRISYKTHVVMPWHKAEDEAREKADGERGIGTTKRGIGPAYADKMHRTPAIRVADMVHSEHLSEKISRVLTDRNKVFAALYGAEPIDPEPIAKQYIEFGRRIAPFVDDAGHRVIQASKAGKKIVFEGAHAVLLDVDHGTYPFVTSSNCSSLGLFTGAGVPPQTVKQYIGVIKAYSTRVGGGPFPTELPNSIGDTIRERGNEYGTTTRRPRRCGWFDAMAVRYSIELCGVTSLAVMLLDVLGTLDELKICTGYTQNGQPVEFFRADMDTLAEVQPIYETMKGWSADISTCRTFDELPIEAKAYIRRLQEVCSVPIRMVSVGPERSATLILDDGVPRA